MKSDSPGVLFIGLPQRSPSTFPPSLSCGSVTKGSESTALLSTRRRVLLLIHRFPTPKKSIYQSGTSSPLGCPTPIPLEKLLMPPPYTPSLCLSGKKCMLKRFKSRVV
ncbi:unnamed protein product [Lactuca virosa]|uniref:Uncharacterized protein n=1 Tax=Lactuca virosa TaxID=75947 RepID=A0AAU9LPN9_9ASTR|nr:unnamed protein product [Lactuca virosa]